MYKGFEILHSGVKNPQRLIVHIPSLKWEVLLNFFFQLILSGISRNQEFFQGRGGSLR